MEPFDLDRFASLVSRLEEVADSLNKAGSRMVEASENNKVAAATFQQVAESNTRAANLMGIAAQQMEDASRRGRF